MPASARADGRGLSVSPLQRAAMAQETRGHIQVYIGIAEITTALLLTASLGCGTVTPVLYDSTWQGGQPW
jgi:hypothetical protein